MAKQRPQLINDEVYHISSRTVGDTVVFKNTDDFYRGIFSIYEFNNSNPVSILRRRQQRQKEKISLQIRRRRASSVDLLEEIEKLEIDIREKLVDILAFCFMPNHIHLLLKQITENGLHDFMVKLGSGYGR